MHLEEQALFIAEAMWNFDKKAVQEYFAFACKSGNYGNIVITDLTGDIFKEFSCENINKIDRFFISISFIPKVTSYTDVYYNSAVVGRIDAEWYCKTFYTYAYAFLR